MTLVFAFNGSPKISKNRNAYVHISISRLIRIYIYFIFNQLQLGKALGAIILEIINAGLEVNKLHLVGHSLGGQMVGRIGGEVKSKSDGKIVLKR